MTTVEGTGETVSEAKFRALQELERLQPELDRAAVQFEVVDEGNRGLLGVGYAPARVIASVEAGAPPEPTQPPADESEKARCIREMLEHVTAAAGLRCRIEVEETEDEIVASCFGGDLGLLIGRHGQTIDALQTLANAIAGRGTDERKLVTVDASGYRDRRRRTLESLAIRAAEDALRTGGPIDLEPMSSVERRVVHERLKEYDGVQTSSEGDEPNRFIVVSPA